MDEKFRRLDRVSHIFTGFRGAEIYTAQHDSTSNKILDESWYPGNPFQSVDDRDQVATWNPPPILEEPKQEDLRLRGSTLIGSFGRLHIENVGLRWVTINHYSIDQGDPHVFAPAVLIDAGLSGALTLLPEPGMRFERSKHYDIRVRSGTGTEFKFDAVFDT